MRTGLLFVLLVLVAGSLLASAADFDAKSFLQGEWTLHVSRAEVDDSKGLTKTTDGLLLWNTTANSGSNAVSGIAFEGSEVATHIAFTFASGSTAVGRCTVQFLASLEGHDGFQTHHSHDEEDDDANDGLHHHEQRRPQEDEEFELSSQEFEGIDDAGAFEHTLFRFSFVQVSADPSVWISSGPYYFRNENVRADYQLVSTSPITLVLTVMVRRDDGQLLEVRTIVGSKIAKAPERSYLQQYGPMFFFALLMIGLQVLKAKLRVDPPPAPSASLVAQRPAAAVAPKKRN